MDLTDAPTAPQASRVTHHDPAPASGPSGQRLPGLDVVRALAMAGVVTMNYHGYLILKGGRRDGGWTYTLFDPWEGPLSTRFAATFVLTAGAGVSLMSRSALHDPARTAAMRWRLVRRGVLLYAFGLAYDYVWAGTILSFYGAMFVLAALMFTLRARWLIVIGLAAAAAGWGIHWWTYEQRLDGEEVGWLTTPGDRSPTGLLVDVFVNGTHPLLPWLAFLCAGMIVGRAYGRSNWRPAACAIGLTSFTIANLVTAASGSGERTGMLLSDDPFERGLVYTASALGTALLAFAAISWLADRFADRPLVDVLRRAGQLSLSIYIAHGLVFNLVVNWLDAVDPGGLATSLSFAAAFWALATSAAVLYHRRFGQGPAEWLYRKLSS